MVESVAVAGGLVVITARTRDGAAACTGCGCVSAWEHSRYQRHVADEAVGGRPVRIDPTVRRLYCENSSCPKKRFAGQVDGLADTERGAVSSHNTDIVPVRFTAYEIRRLLVLTQPQPPQTERLRRVLALQL